MTDTYEGMGLSDEELAAMADETPDVEPELVEDEAEEADEPQTEGEAPAVEEPEGDPEPVEVKDFEPKWQPEAPADYDAKMQAADTRKKELRDRYRDGDIDLDQYEDERDTVEREILALRETKLKADIASEQQQQALAQRWQWEIERFLAQPANAQYRADVPNSRNSELDAVVRMLGNDPTHSEKPMTWFLEEADRWVRARYAEPTAKPAKPAGKPIPPNIGAMPSAELPDVDGDEFAALDKLGGLDIEMALAKMNPADKDRYLRGH